MKPVLYYFINKNHHLFLCVVFAEVGGTSSIVSVLQHLKPCMKGTLGTNLYSRPTSFLRQNFFSNQWRQFGEQIVSSTHATFTFCNGLMQLYLKNASSKCRLTKNFWEEGWTDKVFQAENTLMIQLKNFALSYLFYNAKRLAAMNYNFYRNIWMLRTVRY